MVNIFDSEDDEASKLGLKVSGHRSFPSRPHLVSICPFYRIWGEHHEPWRWLRCAGWVFWTVVFAVGDCSPTGDWPSAEVLDRPEAQLQRFVSGSFLVWKNGGGVASMIDSYIYIYLMYVVVKSWMYWSAETVLVALQWFFFPCFSSWGLPNIPSYFLDDSNGLHIIFDWDFYYHLWTKLFSKILDYVHYVLGALNHQPINFFIIFRWYIPSINPWKSTRCHSSDKSGRIRMMSPMMVREAIPKYGKTYQLFQGLWLSTSIIHIFILILWILWYPYDTMVTLWFMVIFLNIYRTCPISKYPILGPAGPRVIVWPRHPASMRRWFFSPSGRIHQHWDLPSGNLT